jgi:hypothetical protein
MSSVDDPTLAAACDEYDYACFALRLAQRSAQEKHRALVELVRCADPAVAAQINRWLYKAQPTLGEVSMRQVMEMYEAAKPTESLAELLKRERQEAPFEVARFIEAWRDRPVDRGLSTGEQLLLALALCKPEWLPDGYDQPRHGQSRWWRLEDEQLMGILVWSVLKNSK